MFANLGTRHLTWLALSTVPGILLFAACTLLPTPPPTVPPPTPWAATAMPTPIAASETTPTWTPTSTPVLPPTSTPVPPTATPTTLPSPSPTAPAVEPPDSAYAIQHEQAVGAYVVRLWHRTAEDGFGFDDVFTLSRGAQLLARVDQVTALGPETASDLTGEGHPDVVVRTYSGGAHCCFSTIVYDLGDAPRVVLETPLSNCDGTFEDLDGDGVFEYVTCDDRFAYAYCAFAGSPAVRVVLRYDPAVGYVPDSPRFAGTYAGIVVQHRALADSAEPGEMGEWDETIKCGVLPLVLDLLYTGRAQAAWEALVTLYDQPDVSLFWAEVVQSATHSALYVPGSVPVDVPAPPYYMLQLLTACGPEMHWQRVGLLQQGQVACDADVPHRDVYWLEGQLVEIGLVSAGERIALGPEGCTVGCRLDVVRTSDGARQGSIRLDTTAGFPGKVYRVNGIESDHWRLRGDLAWERVSR